MRFFSCTLQKAILRCCGQSKERRISSVRPLSTLIRRCKTAGSVYLLKPAKNYISHLDVKAKRSQRVNTSDTTEKRHSVRHTYLFMSARNITAVVCIQSSARLSTQGGVPSSYSICSTAVACSSVTLLAPRQKKAETAERRNYDGKNTRTHLHLASNPS